MMDNLLAKKSLKRKQSFNCLPNEIIHKICLYLDTKSLKRFSLSCTRCAYVVDNSTVILSKFKLKLTGNFWQSNNKIQQVLSLHRQHSTIDVADITEKDGALLLNIFQKFGPKLLALKISNSQVDDFTLRSMLKSSSILQELFLSEETIIRKLPVINPVSIVRLKSLIVQHCDWIIFRFLSKSQINALEINNYFNECHRGFLEHFLTQQYRLKELTLHGTSCRVLFQQNDINDNFKFNLTNFHFGRSLGRNSDAVNLNIINFLSMNDKTIKSVEISAPNCDHISAFILTNLNRVTSLILNVRGLPKDRTFYETLVDLEPNMHLKTLKLCGFFFQLDFVKVVLMKFPAVKSLELDDWSNTTSVSDMLKFVSLNFPHLQQLYMTEICNGCDVRFDGLKQLSVTYIRNKQHLINFITMNRSVQALKVGFVYIEQISSNFINDLLNLKQVHHLSLTGNDTTLKMICDIIQTNASNSLKTLELSLISCEKSATLASRKTITLNFPIDPCEFSLKFNILF